jgi:hypothetical protein
MINWYNLKYPLMRATANIMNSKKSMIETKTTAHVGTSKGPQPTVIFEGRTNNMVKTNARIAGNVVDITRLMPALPDLPMVLTASTDTYWPQG